MLKISLKAGEAVFIGGAVVVNPSKASITLGVLTETPILKKQQIMKAEDATTPCRRIYFLVQQIYLFEKHDQENYAALSDALKELVEAVPSTASLVAAIATEVGSGDFYRALRACEPLLEYEKTLLDMAAGSKPAD